MILGDNPACSSGGPPVCIDWEPQGEVIKNLEMFEYLRNEVRRKRPYLNAEARKKLVKAAGYSKDEINASILSVMQIRKLREESMEDGAWDRFKNIFAKQLLGGMKNMVLTGKPKSSMARTA